MKLSFFTAASALVVLSLLPGAAAAQDVPTGYPADYADVIKGAEAEGTVIIYSATDQSAVDPLLKDFEALYPKVQVQYNDMGSSELYNRFLSEAAAGTTSGDVLLSPSMDLQLKLAMDGYAMPYHSPEAGNLPSWANYKDQVYGFTFEPIVFMYNKRLLSEDQVPKSHEALAKLSPATKSLLNGKVITQDPERIGSALLFLTHDLKNDKDFWNVAQSLGGMGVKLYTSSGTLLERVTSGEASFGYDVMANYVHSRAQTDPSLGIVYPEDYILVNSRVGFIWKDTPHPNASKLFLDYLLSVRGQKILAQSLFSVRPDVDGPYSAKALIAKYGDKLKPMAVDEDAVAYLDQAKRLDFLGNWQKSLGTH